MEDGIIEDSILAGILLAKGHKITPFKKDGKILFEIFGDTGKSFQEIYGNCPVGALDVLKAIKTCRGMIFTLKNL